MVLPSSVGESVAANLIKLAAPQRPMPSKAGCAGQLAFISTRKPWSRAYGISYKAPIVRLEYLFK